MDSQDYEGDLDDLKKLKVTRQLIKSNKAYVTIKLPCGSTLNYTLTKTNSKWLIDLIRGGDR
jgi:hypothetical protein